MMNLLTTYFCIFFLVVIQVVNLYFNYDFVIFLVSFSILIHFMIMYSVKANQSYFIFLFFAITYPIFILISYFLEVPYHLYLAYQNNELTSFVFFIQTLSLLLMFLRINRKQFFSFSWNEVLDVRKDGLIYYSSYLVLIVMIPLSLIGKDTVLSNGGYGGNSDSSIFFEYCLIFMIVCWLYSGNNRNKLFLLFGMMLVYLVLPLMFGKRLPFIMVSLLIFNFYFLNRFSNKFIILSLFGMLFILSVLALTRVGSSFDVGILNLLVNVDDNGVMANNQGGVVVSAASYLGLVEDGYFDWLFRLSSFFGTLVSPFTVGKFNVSEAYINTSAMKYTAIPGNGGLPGVYFYIWGGWGLLISLSLAFALAFSAVGKSRLISIYVLFLLITFPRWYAYNMLIIFKMGFWLIFIISFCDIFYKRRKKQCS
nr:O-antigen polysaccharide polymerase Wzy [Vibrio parahaemolyticus]